MNKKINIKFLEEDVLIDNGFIEKDNVLDFINYERSNGKIKSSKKTSDEYSDKYIFTIDCLDDSIGDLIISVKFPYKYKNINQNYQDYIERLYVLDKKILKARLKLMSLALSLGVVGGIAISKPVKDFGKKTIDHFEIMTLDNELKYHTGNMLLDGKILPVTEEEHMEFKCYFGETIGKIEDEIREYCREKGLDEEVASAASLKYEYLNSGKSNEAEEINLHKVYTRNKRN